VSTVGYGDVVPHATSGRLLAVVVMLCALAFLTVVTAAITATLLEGTHRRLYASAPTGSTGAHTTQTPRTGGANDGP
jgi:hypothetical protein